MKLRQTRCVPALVALPLVAACVSGTKAARTPEPLAETRLDAQAQRRFLLAMPCSSIRREMDDTLAFAQMTGTEVEMAQSYEADGAYVRAGYFYAKLDMEDDAKRIIEKLRKAGDEDGARMVFFALKPCAVTAFVYE